MAIQNSSAFFMMLERNNTVFWKLKGWIQGCREFGKSQEYRNRFNNGLATIAVVTFVAGIAPSLETQVMPSSEGACWLVHTEMFTKN
jgi:hypothetical protein